MKKSKFLFLLVFLLCFVFILNPLIVYADEVDNEEFNISDIESIETTSNVSTEPKINSRAAIIYERNSKTILYEKNSDSIRAMASTTKIMTAIIVLQNSNLNDIATVSKKAAWTGGSTIGLNSNDKITINDLLYGLMIKSGNDAAVVLAETIAGSVENFATMMNQKAEELGLTCTHFVTPHGLDASEHYTSAKELAILTDYALNIPKFKEIVQTSSYNLTINNKSKHVGNTNELLGYLNGVYGVKTGFTNGAGRCLVTSTKRDNMDIICVVLGADSKKFRSQDSVKLIEYAFQNYKVLNLDERINKTFTNLKLTENISINKGKFKSLKIGLQESNTLVAVKISEEKNIQIGVNYSTSLEAPIENGYRIGTISAKIDDNILISKNIVILETIPRKNNFEFIFEILSNYVQYTSKIFKKAILDSV